MLRSKAQVIQQLADCKTIYDKSGDPSTNRVDQMS